MIFNKDLGHRSFVASYRPVFSQLVGESGVEFYHHVRFELAVSVNLAFHLLVLCQRLLDAVFGVQLGVTAVVDVAGTL